MGLCFGHYKKSKLASQSIGFTDLKTSVHQQQQQQHSAPRKADDSQAHSKHVTTPASAHQDEQHAAFVNHLNSYHSQRFIKPSPSSKLTHARPLDRSNN